VRARRATRPDHPLLTLTPSTRFVTSARRRLRRGFALGLLLAALAAPGAALAQQPAARAVTAQLAAQGGSGVGGTATFTAAGDAAHAPRLEDATRVSLSVSGLAPGAGAQATLHGGTCAAPGASAAQLPARTAAAAGRATASGFVLFRGAENVAFTAVADGAHVVIVAAGGRAVACGAIPGAAAAPTQLPRTGGAVAPSAALAGAGVLLAAAALARRAAGRRSRAR
jgi:LPXTG-motif cell wall-anchored protein